MHDDTAATREFPYESLRRFPDVEAPNLQAWDATDELLAERGIAEAAERSLTGSEIAVIGDAYGAISLRLAAAGLTGVRVHEDLVTGREAFARNAAALGLGGLQLPCELDRELLDGARLVLLQLPRGLAELEEIADAVARWAAHDVVVVAGGRVKHMTLAMNDVLGACFGDVRAELAVRKSRLIVAGGPLPVPDRPPFPVAQAHDDVGLTLCAHGGAFAGARLDLGTRFLLGFLDRIPAGAAVDLGCGTGALAAAYARAHPGAAVIATDRSASAVRSARATMEANGIADRVAVEHDDAASSRAEGSADVVLLNPPFHLGASVHAGAALKLVDAAARLLRPGGELWTVYNSHLDYRRQLEDAVGRTSVEGRSRKFTVTRSVRRPPQA
ncbi:methyltransferase [Sinomonas sp. ASV322]|uniref:class I SAM-dependent methyltransferase n=1 Tax=Sinomonas sp. ASV322 TaxID=3041920 RepID=UPI0027DCF6DA|nr:methyltransferase [Sinomonas sp. ASV322]MDQ4504584.1 methyltransferase [Sinomonas sp. ASV322]